MRSNLRKYLDRRDLGVDQFYRLIKNVSKTLTTFFTSTSDEVSIDHLPTFIHPDDLIGNQELDTYKMMASLMYNAVYTPLALVHTHAHIGAGRIPESVATNDR